MTDTKQNTFAADLALQTEQDDPTMIVLSRVDAEELIAVVRDMVNGDEYFNAFLKCRHCGMSVDNHRSACVIARAEALLARMEASDD